MAFTLKSRRDEVRLDRLALRARRRHSSGRRRRSSARQAPKRSDSGNTGPPRRRATARAALLGVARHRHVHVGHGRPSSSSRRVPPTTQAGTSARAAHQRVAHRDVQPVHPRGEPAGDLVVDRAEPARHLLGEDPLLSLRADQDHRIADLHLWVGPHVHRDVVHAHRADQRVAAASGSARPSHSRGRAASHRRSRSARSRPRSAPPRASGARTRRRRPASKRLSAPTQDSSASAGSSRRSAGSP